MAARILWALGIAITILGGSSSEIGWVDQSLTQQVPTWDGTPEFEFRLQGIRRRRRTHSLPNDLHYILVPGLFSNAAKLYFVEVKKHFRNNLGLSCEIADIDSQASVDTNAQTLKNLMLGRHRETRRRIVLLGHSKGGVDAAAACALPGNWEELKHIVVGVVLGQSPYAGNPIASDFLREGADSKTRGALEILMQTVFETDNLEALEDLTYNNRRQFLQAHPLPDDLRVVSFHTEASMDTEDMTTMSYLGHVTDVVKIEYMCALQIAKYAMWHIAMPVPLALAMCALYLKLHYNEASDGLVTRTDAEVPGSIVIKPDWKADHAWMVLPLSEPNHNRPQPSHVWAALCTFLVD